MLREKASARIKVSSAVRTKNQHYVPRLHLKHFVGSSPKNMIWTFDNELERWRSSTIENTGAQTNFYSVPDGKGGHIDALDDMLTSIENKAVSGYTTLLSGSIPIGQSRADFSMFLATMFCRTPAMINASASGHAHFADVVAQRMVSSRDEFERSAALYERDTGKKMSSYESMRSFLTDRSRYKIAVSQKMGLNIIGAADGIWPLLYYRSWYLLDTDEGQFVTSDSPVHRWVPQNTVHRFYGDGGFKNAEAEITFPLSPTRTLLILGQDARGGLKGPHLRLTCDEVGRMNERRIQAAERYVYSATKDEESARMAVEHRAYKLRFVSGEDADGPTINIKR